MVPAAVVSPWIETNPLLEVEVNAPVAVIETAPFVAIAPAVLEVARKSEPDVKPVVDTSDTRMPVVAAPAVTRIMPVPV
jgi:hypothetical protein